MAASLAPSSQAADWGLMLIKRATGPTGKWHSGGERQITPQWPLFYSQRILCPDVARPRDSESMLSADVQVSPP